MSRFTPDRIATFLTLAVIGASTLYSHAAQPQPPSLPSPPAPPAASKEHRPVGTLAERPKPVANPLVWDAMEKTVHATGSDTKAEFTFWVTNTASADVIINSVSPSCGCTTPSLPPLPWKLIPGTNGQIKASMDIKGKVGHQTKTLTVMSTAGHQILTLKVDIAKDPIQAMAERQANMELAKADHQAVFKGQCINCHVTPTIGKMGEPLFAAACAICHDPEMWATARGEPAGAHHRADVVPNLAELDHPVNKVTWKLTIMNGTGKSGALMPAFHTSNGGPLSEAQIDSLVEYAMKKFPYNPKAKKSAQSSVTKPATP